MGVREAREIAAVAGRLSWALASVVALAGCAHPVESGLRDAARTDRVPADLTVVYDDFRPLWGGERVEVHGDGRLAVARWRPGAPKDEPETWRGRVSPAALRPVVDLLVRIEAWEQRVDARSPRIDEGRARLTVKLGADRTTTWEWANDLEANQRLSRVKNALEALVADARRR